MGALFPVNRPPNVDAQAFPGIGVFWMYDARTFIGEVAMDVQTGNDGDGGGFSVGIGGYYPFQRTNFTPYTGIAVAYSIGSFGGDGGNGLRFTPAIGVLFGRLSTVQIRGELGYFLNTYGERESYVSETVTPDRSSKTYSHGPQFTIGLGF